VTSIIDISDDEGGVLWPVLERHDDWPYSIVTLFSLIDPFLEDWWWKTWPIDWKVFGGGDHSSGGYSTIHYSLLFHSIRIWPSLLGKNWWPDSRFWYIPICILFFIAILLTWWGRRRLTVDCCSGGDWSILIQLFHCEVGDTLCGYWRLIPIEWPTDDYSIDDTWPLFSDIHVDDSLTDIRFNDFENSWYLFRWWPIPFIR